MYEATKKLKKLTKYLISQYIDSGEDLFLKSPSFFDSILFMFTFTRSITNNVILIQLLKKLIIKKLIQHIGYNIIHIFLNEMKSRNKKKKKIKLINLLEY